MTRAESIMKDMMKLVAIFKAICKVLASMVLFHNIPYLIP